MKPICNGHCRVIFALFVLWALVSSALAAGSSVQPCTFPVFESGRTFPTGEWPWALAKGDVDNDGKLDIVSANFDGSSISVLRGTGNGSFLSKIDSAANPRPIGVKLHDLNGDGSLDAVVIGQAAFDYKITSLAGNGDGTFTIIGEHTIYNPLNFQLADVNADSELDLIVIAGDFYVGQLAVYTGIGDGTFNAPTVYDLPNGASSALASGDFDQDGDIDVVYSTSFGIYVWDGDGEGNFSPGWSWTQNNGSVYTGKFNGDDLPDLAVVDQTFHRVRIFTGNGDGTFTRRDEIHNIGEVPGQGEAVDVNNDGFDDLITSNFASNEISVLIARGDGSFHPVVNYTTSGESRGIATGDFNSDGHTDVVTAGARIILLGGRENHIQLTLGRGDGTFVAPINYPIFEGAYPNAAEIADVNGDGRQDVITANSETRGISIFLRTGAFKFSNRLDLLPATYVHNLVVRDIDGNGTADIVAVGLNKVHVLRNLGGAAFADPISFTTANFAVSVGAADLNADGKIDLVTGHRDGQRFVVHFGNGDGTFGAGVDYSVGGDTIVDIAIADLNGDGHSDLAVVYNTGVTLFSRVRIWLNQGNGTFTGGEQYSFGVSIHPNAISIGDIDQDGHKDLVISIDYDPENPAHVRIYRGVGNGTFNYVGRSDVDGWHPNDVVLHDFNLDGKLDLATTNDGSENVSVFEGLGNASFVLRQKPSAGEQARRMAVGHLNMDESPDIVVVNYNGSSFTIIPNGCNREDEPVRRTLFDYDGDGRADLSVRRPSNNIWYLQRTSAGYTAMQYGVEGDRMAPADYDGDGRTDIAVFRPSNGRWYVHMSATQTFEQFGWGQEGDVPVPTDRDGDGRTDLVLFRPSNSTWYTRFADGTFHSIAFGAAGDKPLVGDFDADGRGDVAVFRPANNNWYILKSADGYFVQTWGAEGDIPVPADYDGDGATDLAVFRPSLGRWYIVGSAEGGHSQHNWGQAGDVPVAADYDGDGRSDVAVFRPSNGQWYLLRSRDGILYLPFGQDGDVPTQSAFIY